MVIQCEINGEIFEFAAVYAPHSSRKRVKIWEKMTRYPWLSNALLCGDFNNSLDASDNTAHNSHML